MEVTEERVNKILDALAAAAAGDLSVQIALSGKNDELDAIAMGVNQMIDDLNQQRRKLRKAFMEARDGEEEFKKLADRLKKSNLELEQFAYIASHDLQEPLRMVSSYLQLLERRNKDKLDSESREFIGFAVDGARRMKRLIDDLLAYSRVSTKGRPFLPVACEAAFAKAVKNLEIAVAEKKAEISHTPLPRVAGDEVQIIQLFQNLIGNALKFCKGRTPAVHVSAEPGEGNWVFGVRDNGVGIAPEDHQRIFQIFQRLHTQDEYEGTGIGLAVCQKIVERHGGSIWVESEAGKGATFRFSLPLERGGDAGRR